LYNTCELKFDKFPFKNKPTKKAVTTRNIKWYDISRKHEEIALKMLKVR